MGRVKDRRVFVDVESSCDRRGRVTPSCIVWEDGRRLPVRVVRRSPARTERPDCARGVRYTVEVGPGRARRTLWLDPPGLWHVLAGGGPEGVRSEGSRGRTF